MPECNQKAMKQFEIPVTRTSYSKTKYLKVSATSREEAEKKALEEAGNYEFSESHAEYAVD